MDLHDDAAALVGNLATTTKLRKEGPRVESGSHVVLLSAKPTTDEYECVLYAPEDYPVAGFASTLAQAAHKDGLSGAEDEEFQACLERWRKLSTVDPSANAA